MKKSIIRLPWQNWSFWPWLRYALKWKGWRANMRDNAPLLIGQKGWKLHRCPDGRQCRSEKGGGCARGWCIAFKVQPDEASVPRFPKSRIAPIKQSTKGVGEQ